MTQEMKLDWLAETICEVLEHSMDKSYADDKREELRGRNRFQVIIWLNNLDYSNLSAVAKRLGVSMGDLDTTRKTVRAM